MLRVRHQIACITNWKTKLKFVFVVCFCYYGTCAYLIQCQNLNRENHKRLTYKHVAYVCFCESRGYHTTVHASEKHRFWLNNNNKQQQRRDALASLFTRCRLDVKNSHISHLYCWETEERVYGEFLMDIRSAASQHVFGKHLHADYFWPAQTPWPFVLAW